MKRISIFATAALLCLTVACKNGKKETKQMTEEPSMEKETMNSEIEVIKVALEPKSDSNVTGNITFTQERWIGNHGCQYGRTD